MLEICSGVTNEKEKDGGVTGGSVRLWLEESRVTRAPLCAKCLSMCSWFEPGGSVVVD